MGHVANSSPTGVLHRYTLFAVGFDTSSNEVQESLVLSSSRRVGVVVVVALERQVTVVNGGGQTPVKDC